MEPAPGILITLEGIEGCGKTTQSTRLTGALRAAGLDVIQTREPGGSPLAESLREKVLADASGTMAPVTELLLYLAARSDHVHRRIGPALQRGQWVVCDRFTDATVAYQGDARGLGAERVGELAHWVAGVTPALTLWLNLPVEAGLARVAARGGENRFDRESATFHRRVQAAYARLAAADPVRMIAIDAQGTPDQVQTRVFAAVGQRLAQHLPPRWAEEAYGHGGHAEATAPSPPGTPQP